MGGIEGDTAMTTELDQDHQAEGDEERSEDGGLQKLGHPELVPLPLPVLLPLQGVQAEQCAGVVVTPHQNSLGRNLERLRGSNHWYKFLRMCGGIIVEVLRVFFLRFWIDFPFWGHYFQNVYPWIRVNRITP